MNPVLTSIVSGFFSASFLTVVLYLLGWLRFKKRDDVNVVKAKADAGKTNAEAHILLSDGAIRLVQRLSEDQDKARDEIEKLSLIISDVNARHEKHETESKLEAESLTAKLREALDLIASKKRHCIEIKQRVEYLKDILELRNLDGKPSLSTEQFETLVKKLVEIIKFNEDYENRSKPAVINN